VTKRETPSTLRWRKTNRQSLCENQLLAWTVGDGAFAPGLRSEVVSPGFEGASPSEMAGQVLCGDAVEARQPLLEVAVVGVDVIDVQARRLRGRLSRPRHGPWKAIPGEGGDRLSAVADEMIARRDDACERPFH
jgi:hypothetical protein